MIWCICLMLYIWISLTCFCLECLPSVLAIAFSSWEGKIALHRIIFLFYSFCHEFNQMTVCLFVMLFRSSSLPYFTWSVFTVHSGGFLCCCGLRTWPVTWLCCTECGILRCFCAWLKSLCALPLHQRQRQECFFCSRAHTWINTSRKALEVC